jgi:hypothetical protein
VLLLRWNSEVFAAAAGIQGGAFDSRVVEGKIAGVEELQLS